MDLFTLSPLSEAIPRRLSYFSRRLGSAMLLPRVDVTDVFVSLAFLPCVFDWAGFPREHSNWVVVCWWSYLGCGPELGCSCSPLALSRDWKDLEPC